MSKKITPPKGMASMGGKAVLKKYGWKHFQKLGKASVESKRRERERLAVDKILKDAENP